MCDVDCDTDSSDFENKFFSFWTAKLFCFVFQESIFCKAIIPVISCKYPDPQNCKYTHNIHIFKIFLGGKIYGDTEQIFINY